MPRLRVKVRRASHPRLKPILSQARADVPKEQPLKDDDVIKPTKPKSDIPFTPVSDIDDEKKKNDLKMKIKIKQRKADDQEQDKLNKKYQDRKNKVATWPDTIPNV